MANELDELITVPEAARIKNVDETAVRRAIREGRLKGRQVGRVYVIRRGDLYEWVPSRRGRKRRDEGAKGGACAVAACAVAA